jgi:hypothetical protein
MALLKSFDGLKYKYNGKQTIGSNTITVVKKGDEKIY